MHSEAARQKRFQPRACWYIFDLIVVASISSVQQPCACVFKSQVQERTTCMEIACLVARTSISKGLWLPTLAEFWITGTQANTCHSCRVAHLNSHGPLLHMNVYGCGLAGCVSQVGDTCEHMLVCVLVV